MTCRDFETLWQDRLDGHSTTADREAASTHAVSCEACAEAERRYRTLERALATLAAPEVPAGFSGRTLAAHRRSQTVVRSRLALAGWAAAAAVVAWFVLPDREPARSPTIPLVTEATAPPARSLSESLADLTSATLSLAREASGPAGRLGLDVLEAELDEGETEPTALAAADPGPRSDWFPSLGDGVRPIASPARRAFGFLIPGEPEEPPSPGRG